MRKFLLVLLIVLFAIGILAACAGTAGNCRRIYRHAARLGDHRRRTRVVFDRLRAYLEADPRLYQSHRHCGAGRDPCRCGLRALGEPLAEKLNKGAEELRDGILNHDSDITQTLAEEE